MCLRAWIFNFFIVGMGKTHLNISKGELRKVLQHSWRSKYDKRRYSPHILSPQRNAKVSKFLTEKYAFCVCYLYRLFVYFNSLLLVPSLRSQSGAQSLGKWNILPMIILKKS